MTGWNPDPYDVGPQDPYAGHPLPVPYVGAPVPLYQPYPNPGSWEMSQYAPRPGVPGLALAASILGYLLAALLLVTGVFLVLGAAIIASLVSVADDSLSYHSVEFFVAGLSNWAAAGLLVAGGVMVTVHRAPGRMFFLVGAGLTVVLAFYWTVRFLSAGVTIYAVLFAIFAGVGGALMLQGQVGRWLAVPQLRPAGPLPFPTDRYGRPFGS